MGYGVSLTTLLLSIGVGTATASMSVHISEIFTTFTAGISHFKLGNFDKKIFTYLAIPGVIGGGIGAFAAVHFQNVTLIKSFVSGILLILGILIIIKFIEKKDILEKEYKTPRRIHLLPLGFIAAFVDAFGGGGWGPITTPSLVVTNAHPKKVIGSVSAAEFLVTLSISATFLFTLQTIPWEIIIPMIIGGMLASPLAALIIKKASQRVVGISVGCLIILLSLRTLLNELGIGFFF